MKFKSEDFQHVYGNIMRDGYLSKGAGDMWEPNSRPEDIANIANDILEKWLSEAKVVYGLVTPNVWCEDKDDFKSSMLTHRALLINIEEIKREPCKHEPKFEQGGVQSLTANTCKHCGVRIVVADWKQEEPFRIEVVPNLANETCQKCGSTEFMVARDMIGTRYCVRCHHTWQPKSKKDGE